MTTNDLADPIEAIPVETTSSNPLVTARRVDRGGRGRHRDRLLGLDRGGSTPRSAGTIDRYVHDNAGEVFADPNVAQFRVTTPTKWKATSLPNQFGTIVRVSDDPGGGYEFSVTKTPQPATALDSYEEGLNRLTGQLASNLGASIVLQTKPFPLGELVFKRFVFKRGSTYWRGQLELLKDRLYTIIVKAPERGFGPLPAHGQDVRDPRRALIPVRASQRAPTSMASNSARRSCHSSAVIAYRTWSS